MAENIIKLRLDNKSYDANIRKAREGLLELEKECKAAGKTLSQTEGSNLAYVRSLGQMQTSARGLRGQISELTTAFVDLRAQYNRLSEDGKKSQFGQALNRSMEQLKDRIHDAREEFSKINSEIGGGAKGGFGGLNFDSLAAGAKKFAGVLGLAVGAIDVLGSEVNKIRELANEGIRMAEAGDGIKHAFDQIGSIGLLDELREATHGTVNDIELMKAAVQANDFRIPLEELGKYLEFAQLKASQTGQSVDYLTQSIVTGLGRQSLMILDNLGLSAAEIRENMKGGASMAEAVGKIIDKQLSEVGEHYETAAERATKRTVELQNAQIAVGEQLLPLKSAWSDFLTSVEIDCLKVIAKLGEMFSEAQRIKNLQNDMFGGTGGSLADRQFDAFKRLKTRSAQENDIRGLTDQYNRRINSLGGQRAAIQKQIASERAKGASVHDTAYLSGQLRSINDQIKATRSERDSFLSRANQWMNKPEATTATPAASGGSTKSGKGGRGGTTTQKVEEILPVGSVAAMNKELSELRKLQEKATTTEGWQKQQIEIDNLTTKIKILKGEIPDPNKMQKGAGASVVEEGTKTKEPKVDKIEIELPEKKIFDLTDTKAFKDTQKVTNLLGGITSGLEQMGVEVPDGISKMLGVLQGLLTITSAINSVLMGIQVATIVDTIIPLATGGVVHAAGGVRVPGNHYSGDMVPAYLNSGELVLNKAQQGNLASLLSNTGIGNMNLTATIKGEQIRLALNRNGQRTGRGEYVTSNRG